MNPDQLLEQYRKTLASYARPENEFLLGLESEFLGLEASSHQPLQFSGPNGIEAVLKNLSLSGTYEKFFDSGHLIELNSPAKKISLEPGGQIELSACPVQGIKAIKDQLDEFMMELRKVGSDLGICWFVIGFHPFARQQDLDWVPKNRYKVMREYLPTRCTGWEDMMRRTAGNQLNIDFSSIPDAAKKMRTILALTSLTSALFARSPWYEGHYRGNLSERMRTWGKMDTDRSGLLEYFFVDDPNYDHYLDYCIKRPMMFLKRKDQWIGMKGKTFIDFLKDGGEGYSFEQGDWETHLSGVFTEVRMKNCIEIRGADLQCPESILWLVAWWKAFVYDDLAMDEVWNLLRSFNYGERLQFHTDITRLGPQAYLGKSLGWDLLDQLYPIAKAGMNRLIKKGEADLYEMQLLQTLWEQRIQPRKTSAEILLETFGHDPSPEKLISALSICPGDSSNSATISK